MTTEGQFNEGSNYEKMQQKFRESARALLAAMPPHEAARLLKDSGYTPEENDGEHAYQALRKAGYRPEMDDYGEVSWREPIKEE
jgi:hypothetical protein